MKHSDDHLACRTDSKKGRSNSCFCTEDPSTLLKDVTSIRTRHDQSVDEVLSFLDTVALSRNPEPEEDRRVI